MELGFKIDELDTIVREPGHYGDEDYYAAMLRRWLDWAPPNHSPPTLSALVAAMRVVGNESVAYDLCKWCSLWLGGGEWYRIQVCTQEGMQRGFVVYHYRDFLTIMVRHSGVMVG